ncbi:MAG: nuclear transport factor 2 family protein [Phycisphaerales bacterium]|nr:nuclear transport factor 2 family protein [Phycisphaerales bacterium]
MARKKTKTAPAKKKTTRGKTTVKKTTAKRAGKARPATKSAATTFSVSTGKGATAAEIGASLVSLYNEGRWEEPERKWFAEDIESIEGSGMGWRGREAVKGKGEWWYSQNTVLGGSAEGPYVGASGFSVKFRIEVVEKSSGMKTRMEEVGVYTVKDGKIIREEYMYGPMQQERVPV